MVPPAFIVIPLYEAVARIRWQVSARSRLKSGRTFTGGGRHETRGPLDDDNDKEEKEEEEEAAPLPTTHSRRARLCRENV